MSHRFSVVIPARNRPHTLAFTLRTCLAQEFDDYEIVVSDNSQKADIEAVVARANSPRIRYVRTPRSLAITDSWEFAVEQAGGEYVTILGEDDALAFHSLRDIDRLLRQSGAELLRWDSALYGWPDTTLQSHWLPNTLLVPLQMRESHHEIVRHDSARTIQSVVDGDTCYSKLPMIYCSAVHRNLLARLREKTGRVFKTRVPDVYSGVALAHVAGSYCNVNAPLVVSGFSANSTGINVFFLKHQDSAVRDEYQRFSDEAGHTIDPRVPNLPPLIACVADSFFHAQKALFPDDTSLRVDRRKLVAVCLHHFDARTESDWTFALAECRRSLGDDPALLDWFDGTVAPRPFVPRQPPRPYRRYGGEHLYLDTTEFGITDIYGAAELFEKVLGYQRDGTTARLRTAAENGVSAGLFAFQEKEAMIQALTATAAERLTAINQLAGNWREANQAGQEKEAVIEALTATATERLAAIEEKEAAIQALSATAAERLTAIDQLTGNWREADRAAQEKEAVIEALSATAAERLAAVEEKEVAIRALSATAAERLRLVEQKEVAIQALTATATERLRLVERQEREITALRKQVTAAVVTPAAPATVVAPAVRHVGARIG